MKELCPHKKPVLNSRAEYHHGYGYIQSTSCQPCNNVRSKAVYYARRDRGSSIHWKEYILKAAYGREHEESRDLAPCDRCEKHRGVLHIAIVSQVEAGGKTYRARRKLCGTCRAAFDDWWESLRRKEAV